jgi:hypothetical protein
MINPFEVDADLKKMNSIHKMFMRNRERERQKNDKMRPQNRAPNLASANGPKFTASIETAFS